MVGYCGLLMMRDVAHKMRFALSFITLLQLRLPPLSSVVMDEGWVDDRRRRLGLVQIPTEICNFTFWSRKTGIIEMMFSPVISHSIVYFQQHSRQFIKKMRKYKTISPPKTSFSNKMALFFSRRILANSSGNVLLRKRRLGWSRTHDHVGWRGGHF